MLDTGLEQGNKRDTSLPTDNRDVQEMERARNGHNGHGTGMVRGTTTTATTQFMSMANEGTMDRPEAGGLERRLAERKRNFRAMCWYSQMYRP